MFLNSIFIILKSGQKIIWEVIHDYTNMKQNLRKVRGSLVTDTEPLFVVVFSVIKVECHKNDTDLYT